MITQNEISADYADYAEKIPSTRSMTTPLECGTPAASMKRLLENAMYRRTATGRGALAAR
jgi:hypothetical protein